MVVYITPDEIQDTYVEVNDDMLLNANTYNALIQKSKLSLTRTDLLMFFSC